MKIVIVSWAHYSHTTATIPLVNELLKQGHEIYYFGKEKFDYLFPQNKFIKYIPYCVNQEEVELIIEETFEMMEVLSYEINDKQSVINFRNTYEKYNMKLQMLYYEDVFEKIKEINPDFIFRDACSFFGKMIGTKLNIPIHGYLTNLAFSKEYVFSNPKKILPLLFGINLDFLTDKEIQEVFEELEDFNKTYSEHLGIPRKAVLYTYDPEEDRNIIFSSPKLQPTINNTNKKYYITTPPVLVNNNQLNQVRIKEKLIYVSTGSTFYAVDKFYNSIINAFKNSEYQVIITIPLEEEEITVRNLPENIMIKKFVDQNEMLKKASLFITHGGYNSICEAIYHEVPMILFPITADQYINTHVIEELKIGKEMVRENLNSSYVKLLCEEVITSDEFSTNLKMLAESFEDSLPLEEVVDELLNCSKKV